MSQLDLNEIRAMLRAREAADAAGRARGSARKPPRTPQSPAAAVSPIAPVALTRFEPEPQPGPPVAFAPPPAPPPAFKRSAFGLRDEAGPGPAEPASLAAPAASPPAPEPQPGDALSLPQACAATLAELVRCAEALEALSCVDLDGIRYAQRTREAAMVPSMS